MGTGKLSGKPGEMLGEGGGVTLQWTGVPSRGSSNTPIVSSCLGNRDKLRLGEPIGSSTDFFKLG